MINVTNVTKTYNINKNTKFTALKNVSFYVDSGEFVAVMGQSGAGKSTLLHLLACIDEFEMGEITIDGIDIKKLNDKGLASLRNRFIGTVFQDFALISDYSVFENVMTPLFFTKMERKQKKEKVFEALKATGMYDIRNKNVQNLSGGQKQRVAISRALVNSPKLILADEPTGALDTKTSQEIMDLFCMLNSNGSTIIVITHEESVASCASRKIVISDGEIIDDTAKN